MAAQANVGVQGNSGRDDESPSRSFVTQTGHQPSHRPGLIAPHFSFAARLCFPVYKAHRPYRGIYGADPNPSRFCDDAEGTS